SGKCVAPVPALCQPTQNNTVWGCVWDLSSVTPKLVDVQVVGDGMFQVKAPACGGPAANKTGDACPVVGDVAVSGCAPTNPSYDAKSGKCVAPVPALCQPTQNNTVWGCVWDLSGASTKVSAAASSPSLSVNGGSSAGVFVGTIAGVAAVVAAVAAAVANKKRKSKAPASTTDAFLEKSSPQASGSQLSRHV
ncbi:hypothetical protein PybrP1_007062, partial [[Pythium] brassicae (nom. inval.)]